MCPYSLEINISSSFFCTSGKETVENLKISRGQLGPCQENRIKRQQTVSSAGCKVLVPNAGFLLASIPSYCRFKPIECSYSESVSVSVPQDKIRGSALHVHRVSFVSNDRCFSSISHPQSVVHLAHHASMTAAIMRGRFTPTKWATDNPPTTGTIVRKVARSRVTL